MVRPVVKIINKYDAGFFPKSDEINLQSNENPYPPPKDVVESILKAIDFVNRYPDPEYGELKMAIAEYLSIDKENIFLGNGIGGCINDICNALIEQFDEVTIPMPSYTMYVMYSMLREASLNLPVYPYYRIDFENLVESSKSSKIVFLCSPNNPTGNSLSLEGIREVAESVRGYVVVDEAYVEFAKESALKLADEYENLIILRTFSKFFGLAGLRIGYGICKDDEVVSAIEKIRLPFCISQVSLQAGITALKCIDYYNNIREKILKERDFLFKELSKFERLDVFPSDANFILVRVKDNIGLSKKLRERKILVRDVTGLMGLEGEHVRITVGKPNENLALINALREILNE